MIFGTGMQSGAQCGAAAVEAAVEGEQIMAAVLVLALRNGRTRYPGIWFCRLPAVTSLLSIVHVEVASLMASMYSWRPELFRECPRQLPAGRLPTAIVAS
eukprot:jgi/Ulvmu1/10140/UM006_0094.1